MSKEKMMKPKEYKQLVNDLTDKLLKQKKITWKEGETRNCMYRNKPKFQKIVSFFESQKDKKHREYMVFFQFVDHLVRDKNFTERMEQIYEVFPFLKDEFVKDFKFKERDLRVSLYRYGGDVFGVVFSFDVFERELNESEDE